MLRCVIEIGTNEEDQTMFSAQWDDGLEAVATKQEEDMAKLVYVAIYAASEYITQHTLRGSTVIECEDFKGHVNKSLDAYFKKSMK